MTNCYEDLWDIYWCELSDGSSGNCAEFEHFRAVFGFRLASVGYTDLTVKASGE